MKKKFAILLVFMFSLMSILTGCNLFNSNNYAALSSIVATSGNISITRESLINGYNNGGYQYNSSYGYTTEQAFKLTIDELVNQEYLLSYVDKMAELDARYQLSSDDYRVIVSNSWDYVASNLESYADLVRKDFYNTKTQEEKAEDEASEPEFAPQKNYATKFENVDGKAVLITTQEDDTLTVTNDVVLNSYSEALTFAKTRFNYQNFIKSRESDFKTLVWRRYITALKISQKSYGHTDMTDSAVFEREMSKLFEANYKSQKIAKLEKIYQLTNGFEYNNNLGAYTVTDSILDQIANAYKQSYMENVSAYNSSKTQFYKDLTGTTNREKFVYYGRTGDETLITCLHILVKLSDKQIADIKSNKADTSLSQSAIDAMVAELKLAKNTYATERDFETGENVLDEEGNKVTISVEDLYRNLQIELANETKLERVVEIFNNYLYKYNVDTGIINAKYDYVVGTQTSAMVESFTNEVRALYNAGNVGAVSMVLEENDNYSGYHIILYTGTLNNLFASQAELNSLTAENVVSKLLFEKTSISYNQTLFEKYFDQVAKDNFNIYRNSIISTEKKGINTVYQTKNFQDLYK